MTTTCGHCTRPTTNGTTLCPHCTRTLTHAITNTHAYTLDLTTIRTRLQAIRYDQPRGTGGTKTIPLPIDHRFTDPTGTPDDQGTPGGHGTGQGTQLDHDATTTLTTWTNRTLTTWPPNPKPTCNDPLCRRCQPLTAETQARRPPRRTITRDGTTLTPTQACAYLLRMLPRITTAHWAPQMLHELLTIEHRLRRFVDIPPDRWYAGPCTAGQTRLEYAALCGVDLYADLGAPTVTCPDCGWAYDVQARRDWLLAAAEDRWETATTIAHALRLLAGVDQEEAKLAARIRQWAARGRLRPRDTTTINGRSRPRYRIGDVLDVVLEDQESRGTAPQTTASC